MIILKLNKNQIDTLKRFTGDDFYSIESAPEVSIEYSTRNKQLSDEKLLLLSFILKSSNYSISSVDLEQMVKSYTNERKLEEDKFSPTSYKRMITGLIKDKYIMLTPQGLFKLNLEKDLNSKRKIVFEKHARPQKKAKDESNVMLSSDTPDVFETQPSTNAPVQQPWIVEELPEDMPPSSADNVTVNEDTSDVREAPSVPEPVQEHWTMQELEEELLADMPSSSADNVTVNEDTSDVREAPSAPEPVQEHWTMQELEEELLVDMPSSSAHDFTAIADEVSSADTPTPNQSKKRIKKSAENKPAAKPLDDHPIDLDNVLKNAASKQQSSKTSRLFNKKPEEEVNKKTGTEASPTIPHQQKKTNR